MSKIIDLRVGSRRILRCVDGQHYIIGHEPTPITIIRAYHTDATSLLTIIKPWLVSATITTNYALLSVIASPASYSYVHRCVIYAGIEADRGLTIKYFVTYANETPIFLDSSRKEIFTVDEITKRTSIVAKLPSL